MNDPKTRILRQVSGEQDKLLKIIEALRFASIDTIKMRDGQITYMEVKLSINFDDPTSFKKAIEELKTIPL